MKKRMASAHSAEKKTFFPLKKMKQNSIWFTIRNESPKKEKRNINIVMMMVVMIRKEKQSKRIDDYFNGAANTRE